MHWTTNRTYILCLLKFSFWYISSSARIIFLWNNMVIWSTVCQLTDHWSIYIFWELSPQTLVHSINHVRIVKKIKHTGKTSKTCFGCEQHGDACPSPWRDHQPSTLRWPLGQGNADPVAWSGSIAGWFWGQIWPCRNCKHQLSPARRCLRALWSEQGSRRTQESEGWHYSGTARLPQLLLSEWRSHS